MSVNTPPLLYSFRRCPYAIRARMALWSAGIKVDLHEVSFRNKPKHMLEVSPKGTVPVLCTGDLVLEESLDIMLWSLPQNDPEGWYQPLSDEQKTAGLALINENDFGFKPWLDKYKYADRHPEHTQEYYRQQGEQFLTKLETLLEENGYLLGPELSFADIGIFPFIRQFSMVDTTWFEQCSCPLVRNWLEQILALPLFAQVMSKSRGSGPLDMII